MATLALFMLLLAAYFAWQALWSASGPNPDPNSSPHPHPHPSPSLSPNLNPNPNPNPNLTRSLGYLPALGVVGVVEMLLPGSHMVSVDYR